MSEIGWEQFIWTHTNEVLKVVLKSIFCHNLGLGAISLIHTQNNFRVLITYFQYLFVTSFLCTGSPNYLERVG